jgi:SPP1 gp7 family putative phage head morphogenesis protein
MTAMNKAERYIKRYLDDAELDAIAKYDRWLKVVFAHIPWGAGEHEIHQYHLPQPALLSTILYQQSAAIFTAGQAHGDADAATIRKKHRVKLADLPVLESSREFTPEESIKVLRNRQIKLAGDVEAELVTGIKKELLDYLVSGDRLAAQRGVAALLQHNEARAANIIRTETTYAYNRGRLSSYRENSVDYVRFSAILDSRTSQQCRSRHGLVMAMNNPELSAITPPLHGHCRSVLTPIYSRYEPGLITPESTDWSKAAPLPKGWRMDAKQVAGSAPKEGRDIYAERDYTEARKELEQVYKTISRNEPRITSTVRKSVRKSGGEMTGLEYRLKTLESYLRKVKADFVTVRQFDEKVTPLEVARKINDVIRYTAIASVMGLVNTYFLTVRFLTDAGYTLVKTKNTWLDDHSAYKGINSVFRDPKGQTFELQFHTPESFDAKQNQMHEYYEEQRASSTSPERKKELEALMMELSRQLVRPVNIDKIK